MITDVNRDHIAIYNKYKEILEGSRGYNDYHGELIEWEKFLDHRYQNTD